MATKTLPDTQSGAFPGETPSLAGDVEATLLNDNTVRTQGQILQIPPGPGRRGYAKARVDVRHLLDGSWRIYHHDQLIAIPAATTGPPSSRLGRCHCDGPPGGGVTFSLTR
jgi:hypothetical protein